MTDVSKLIQEMQQSCEQWPSPDILQAIVDEGDKAIEPLREIVREGARDPQTPYVDLAVGMLGELRASSATEDILQIFRSGDEDILEWAFDALRVLGNSPPAMLEELVRDEKLDWFRRGMAINVYEDLAQKDDSARDRLVATLIELLEALTKRGSKKLDSDEFTLAGSIVSALCRFATPESRPVIDAAFDAGVVDEMFVTQDDVIKAFEEGGTPPQESNRSFLEFYRDRYEDEMEQDEEDEMDADLDDDEDEGDFDEDEPRLLDDDPSSEPTGSGVIKVEKVGRNDACPCGSGKKYKKCCGM